MSELKTFTAEQMRGCPPIELDNGDFLYSDGVKIWTLNDDEERLWCRFIECNPIDRMEAIAKHLFELMPEMNEIYISIKELPIIREGDSAITSSMIELSINPFIGTELTEITREEVMK